MDSNYTKQVYMARELFQKYDQAKIIERFDLECDEDYLYIPFLGRRYRVARTDGRVDAAEERTGSRADASENRADGRVDAAEERTGSRADAPCNRADGRVDAAEEPGGFRLCEDYNVVMTIYDALCHPKGRPQLSGEWVPLYALQVTMSSPGTDTFTQKYADAFAGRVPLLWKACSDIGGERLPVAAGADVYWQFDLFPFFPVQLRFWDADEEFPAQFRLLWDRNALQFMHFETLYYALGHLMERLAQCAGLLQNKGRQ